MGSTHEEGRPTTSISVDDEQNDHSVTYNNKNLLSFRVANEIGSPRYAQQSPPKNVLLSTSPKKNSARKSLQLNDIPMDQEQAAEMPSKELRHWHTLILNLRRAIDQVYQECEIDDNLFHCNETITILRTALEDFNSLIDRIKKQEKFEKVFDIFTAYF